MSRSALGGESAVCSALLFVSCFSSSSFLSALDSYVLREGSALMEGSAGTSLIVLEESNCARAFFLSVCQGSSSSSA